MNLTLQENTAALFLKHSSTEVQSAMDFFHHRYYRLNRMSMKLIGHWPFQTISVRVVIGAVVISFGLSILIPQVIAIGTHLDNRNFIMECAVPLVFDGFCFTKGFNSLLNSHKMAKLLNRIRADWDVLARDRDVDLLHKYAERGRQMTIAYAVLSHTCCILWVTQPIIPKIIDVFLKNGTEPGQFPIPINYYYIDMQKYYFYIILHCYAYTFLGFFMAASCDSMFIVYVQHGCGLFAILGRKLQRLGRSKPLTGATDSPNELDKPDIVCKYLSSCIDKHNDAIEYAELINATYSWCFFFILGLNMILISLIGIQIITRIDKPEEIMKFAICNVIAMVHLYVESYMAQILMDHSINIHHYLLNGNWYRLPEKAKKLLPLIIMRCNVPCKLNAAKITIMSVKAFGSILKTSISYFTLFRSL